MCGGGEGLRSCDKGAVLAASTATTSFKKASSLDWEVPGDGESPISFSCLAKWLLALTVKMLPYFLHLLAMGSCSAFVC